LARDQRRLAAIISADVAGFSRLMGVDEGGTLASLKSHLQALFDPKISEYGGRIVKTTGDGLLLEFPSVVDAVRCAVDVQRGMAERNAGVPTDQRIDFRIGINVGDIIIDGDDIFGDGVNVAARLQALAEPGEICVSKVVRDQVLDKLSLTFEDLGAQKVKNIARPVEAYRVEVGTAVPSAVSKAHRSWQRFARSRALRWFAAGFVAFVAVGVGVLAMTQFGKGAQIAEPPAFSVAVLTFSVPGGTPADQQFADLVTQGIASALRRTTTYVKVILHPITVESSQIIEMRAIARERNVRYLLRGNVRIEGDNAETTARLIEAENATEVWTGQFAGARSKLFAESGGASLAFIRDLRNALWMAEEQRASHRSPQDAKTPADLVLRAAILRRDLTPKRLQEARALADEALRLDSNFVMALRERVIINGLIWEYDPSANRVQLGQEMAEFTGRALAIDRSDPGVWRDRAAALSMQWRWNAALEALAEAHRLDPSNIGDAIDRVWQLSMMGNADESVRIAESALAAEPGLDLDPGFRHNQCYAQLLLGQFDKAVSSCEKSVAGGESWWPWFFLTVAYSQSGDMAKATTAKAELLKRRPSFSIAQLNAMGLSDNSVYLKQADDNVIAGLRKAGVPEK